MKHEDFETLVWALGIIAIVTASGMVWGWTGALFSFGAVFVGWVMWKQLLTVLAHR